MLRYFVYAGFLITAFFYWTGRPVAQPPGVLAPDPPLQGPVEGAAAFSHEAFRIEPLATFEVRARVLSAERYYLGQEAELSPIDLALGWGPMSDSRILDSFTISQSGRWYWWRYKNLPIPRKEVVLNSANMHMVPATGDIDRQLKSVKTGQMVRFKGYLIEVQGADGWRWRSSLTRDDAGNHACELVWVEEFEVLET
jgi:hypothetical protein